MTVRDRIRASMEGIKAHGQRLVQLNVDLLKAELQQKAQQYGAAAGLFVAAALVALFALGFALATVAVALDLVLPLWLALLIVTAVLFLLVAVLLLVGRDSLRKATTPAPETAVTEARATADVFKTGVGRVGARARSGRISPTTPGSSAAASPSAVTPVTPPVRPTATMPVTPPPASTGSSPAGGGPSTATMPVTPPPAPPKKAPAGQDDAAPETAPPPAGETRGEP